MKMLLRLSAALAILMTALPAQAGTQGRVTGKVTDSAGKPIEGVTVTVTTPAIKNFKLSTKTSSDGRYGLIVNDATLPYRIHFEKEGYVPVESEKKLSTVEIKTMDQTLLKPSEAPAGKGGSPAAAAAPSGNDQAALAYNAGVDLTGEETITAVEDGDLQSQLVEGMGGLEAQESGTRDDRGVGVMLLGVGAHGDRVCGLSDNERTRAAEPVERGDRDVFKRSLAATKQLSQVPALELREPLQFWSDEQSGERITRRAQGYGQGSGCAQRHVAGKPQPI